MAASHVVNIPELLNEIFFASLLEPGLPQCSLMEAPLNVSQVCKWWRAVALANPRLWSRLHLSHSLEEGPDTRDPSFVLSVISVWLARSDPVPFSLVLNIGVGNMSHRESIPVWNTRIRELLTQNSRRWELLDVNILPLVMEIGQPDTGVEFTHLKKLLNGLRYVPEVQTYRILNAPKLEYLTLHGGLQAPPRRLIIDCNMSLSVKAITLWNMSLSLCLTHPISITNLVLYNVHILLKDIEKFPDLFPLLERFEVTDCVKHGYDVEDPESFVVLDSLLELVVHGNYYYDFPMSYITAPHLRSLSLFDEDDALGEILEFPATVPFIARSNPPLEELKCIGIEVNCDEFNKFLEMVPELRELHIIDAPISNYTLKKLTSASSESGPSSLLCPGLETLICNYATDSSCDDHHPPISIDLETICCLLTQRIGRLVNVGLPMSDEELQHIEGICLHPYPGLNLYKVGPPHYYLQGSLRSQENLSQAPV